MTTLTIAEMIEEIGEPQNYAEQCLLDRKREGKKNYAELQVGIDEAKTDTFKEIDQRSQGIEWACALAYRSAIRCYREFGDKPVIKDASL